MTAPQRPRASAGVHARRLAGESQDGAQKPPQRRHTLSRPGSLSTEVAALLGPSASSGKPRKYRNQPVEINGIQFDSKKEGARYDELRFMQRNGVIRDLEVHPRFPLVVHGQDCGVYEADFAWIDPETGERVVEDVKSEATRKLPTYRLKRRLVWALYAIAIREV